MSILENMDKINWADAERHLQYTRHRPMFDRSFFQLIEELSGKQNYAADVVELRKKYLSDIDTWINSSRINRISGLDSFPDRDVIIGVTHSLDDLHITHHQSLVVYEKSYPYLKRMRPDITERTVDNLAVGDVLLLEVPFAYYGDLHPQTNEILNRCLELKIPVHIDAAWYGCLKDFEFDYSHPAIESVSFSLSKGLGLGSHRTGIRYSKKRWPGPVSIINDFNMCVVSTIWYGINFMNEFPIDYLQEKYGEAYELVCKKLNLTKTKAIHLAFKHNGYESVPVGIRPFLRTLADNLDELK